MSLVTAHRPTTEKVVLGAMDQVGETGSPACFPPIGPLDTTSLAQRDGVQLQDHWSSRVAIDSTRGRTKQGEEGSPAATLVFDASVVEGLKDIAVGDRLLVLTWLDRADRSVLTVHPRDDRNAPMRGVFSTRSQDRPNPIGLHRVQVTRIHDGLRFEVQDLEALDATPILDVKPILDALPER